MPALLPSLLIGLPTLLISTHLVLAADEKVPTLDYGPSCRAAVATAAIASRDENSCKQDEETARGTLNKDWGQYSATQRTHCVRLSTLGGSPSYVELLTCLELAKASSTMPDDIPPVNDGSAKR